MVSSARLRTAVLLAPLASLVLAFCVGHNLADPDLWHRLAVGRYVFEHGSVPRQDVFSYMPVKEHWIDHEWGSGVVFHAVREVLGGPGLLGLKVTLFAAVLLLAALATRPGRASWRTSLPALAVTAWALAPGFSSTVRCQGFTFAFFALWLAVIERARQGRPGLLWVLPATAVVWANLHGGFVAGLGLLVMASAVAVLQRRSPWTYLVVLALSAGLTLVNPYGLEYWRYLLEALSMPRPDIVEWRPMGLAEALGGRKGLVLMAAATVIGLARRLVEKGRHRDPLGLLVLAVTGALALRHQRHATLFVIAATVYGWPLWFGLWEGLKERAVERWEPLFVSRSVGLVWLAARVTAVTTLLLGSALVWWGEPLSPDEDETFYPVAAVRQVEELGLEGNLLVPFNWGSYALWKLHPTCKVSMDGRYEETYTQEVFDLNHDFFHHRAGWERFLTGYPHDLVLIYTDSDTRRALDRSSDWSRVHLDGTAALYVRSSAGFVR